MTDRTSSCRHILYPYLVDKSVINYNFKFHRKRRPDERRRQALKNQRIHGRTPHRGSSGLISDRTRAAASTAAATVRRSIRSRRARLRWQTRPERRPEPHVPSSRPDPKRGAERMLQRRRHRRTVNSSPPSRSPNTAEEEEEEEEEEAPPAATDSSKSGPRTSNSTICVFVVGDRLLSLTIKTPITPAVVPRFERVHPLHVPDGSVVPVQQRRDVNRRAGDAKRIGSNRPKRSDVIAGGEIVAAEQDHHDGPVGGERGVRRAALEPSGRQRVPHTAQVHLTD